MSPARQKQARLTRILAIRKANLRAAEAHLSGASVQAIAAEARVGTVQALISTAATPSGETALSALRGAATLRHILRPALEAATHRARETANAKAIAATRLADADARHDRSSRDCAKARATSEREAEEREGDERIPTRRPR